ncbi:MAG: DNA alkylation repair protein [Muribaculaceae bacterium]|nr:DNA alkylation repair protein [Muribaculaceae bacterium]
MTTFAKNRLAMCEIWQQQLRDISRPEKIKILSSFFKTGKGEYGEGDKFLGITVPDNRKVAITHAFDPIEDIHEMLCHEIHEFRLSALLALVHRYKKAKADTEQSAIIDFYLANAHRCNNWDLVDLSAPYILGTHLLNHPSPAILDNLAASDNLWSQRIAIVATLTLIRNNRYDDTLRLAERYLSHHHQLIHKATGWMLREVGKKDLPTLLDFLDRWADAMPRTALRYAIERLTAEKRQFYMAFSKKTD